MHRDVGVERKVPRQFVGAVHTIDDVPDISWLLAERDVSMKIAIGEIAFQDQGKVVFLVLDTWFVVQAKSADAAQLRFAAALFA